MKETMVSATPMGYAGQMKPAVVVEAADKASEAVTIPEGGSAALKLLDFPLTEAMLQRLQEAAELPRESWLKDNLKLHVREAEYHAKLAHEAREKLPRLRRKVTHYRSAILSYMVGWGVVGFAMGVVLAVSQLLEKHGPTVTIHGTIGAGVLYLLSGAIFGGLFAWLGHEHATSMADDYADQHGEMVEIANEHEAERLYHLRQAEEFESALRKRQFAWLFDIEP